LIVAKRKELDDAGLDSGAETIWTLLRPMIAVPSVATIWRILVARGQVIAQPAKAPKRAARTWTAERANECWALDDTGWVLADGCEVKILNVLDDHSRYCVASTAMPSCTGAAVLAVLSVAAAFLGWPARFWSDNAKAFRNVLAAALGQLGVVASHTRPYHPESNGKVERFHQTLKKWLAKQPAATTVEELQAQLDTFRTIYNTQRPHRALERRCPATVWEHAPKTGPAARPLGTPTTVHHTLVSNGRCYAGQFAVTIGATHNDQRALAVITGTACHVFIDGRLIRQLTIDPTKRTQPLHAGTGRPSTVRDVPRHV
jgi:transposase InsO family protein